VRLKCRVFVVKPAQLQWSGFSCGKNRCNGSVPVPTLTRNRSSGLEPLLTLVWAYCSFCSNCVSLSCLLSSGWFYSLMAIDRGRLSLKCFWAGLGLQGHCTDPGLSVFVFSFEASGWCRVCLICTLSHFLTFLCSSTFVLSIFDFCMRGVFTKWENWEYAQPQAQVHLMAVRAMWPYHSVYRENNIAFGLSHSTRYHFQHSD